MNETTSGTTHGTLDSKTPLYMEENSNRTQAVEILAVRQELVELERKLIPLLNQVRKLLGKKPLTPWT